MPEDRHAAVRAMPFPVLARALGIDLSRFKERKGGTEHAGPCPVLRPKKNLTSFSYNREGRFACFSRAAKGRGAIDLAMAVNGIGFQVAVDLLRPYASSVVTQAAAPQVRLAQELPSENEARAFTYEKHFVDSAWLQARNLGPGTLERYGVGQYDNPARQSAYKGRVLIRMQRFSDGQTVGYLARDVRTEEERGADPKYVMPNGLHKSLEVFGALTCPPNPLRR